MQTISLSELNNKLVVPAASSSYPTLGVAYRHDSYSIDCSERLVKTGKNYYDSKELIPEGLRMSTAAEETALQLGYEKTGIDPRSEQAKAFNDMFGRDNYGWYAWQWTETGLRVPKGRKADAYETDAKGRKYWPRIVLIGDQEVGEILVPEGKRRLVVEWDEVFGVPRVTEYINYSHKPYINYSHKPYTTHSYFNPIPPKDDRSGNYDVAVARNGYWLHYGVGRCIEVYADYGRWLAHSVKGFRSVRGLVPEIEKE